jgi:hypothetical protein
VSKIVVFDFDETLGYFTELGVFLDCLSEFLQKDHSKFTAEEFNAILDLYPEFLRPKIIPILNYLKYRKQEGNCCKIMIYTNNNGPRAWAQNIISYLESKLHYKLFDQIIAAFKINGQQIEMCRTTHDKHMKDLMRCTKLPQNAEILFVDDSLYPEMMHDSVYYIHLDPYYYMLTFDEMMKRFKNSEIGKKILDGEHVAKFEIEMKKCWEKNDFEVVKKKMKEYRLEKIMSKQIMILLQKFFNSCLHHANKPIVPMHTKTRRRRGVLKNKVKLKGRTQKDYE